MRTTLMWLAVAGSLAVAGCSSDKAGMTTAVDGDPSTPQYAVMTRVPSGPDTVTGLLYVVSSLETKGLVDDARAYELTGGGLLAPIEGERALLYFSAVEPTVTRFDIAGGDELSKGETLSAANLGATSLAFLAQTAPDRIWLEAYPTLSLVPLNPLTMELGEPVALTNAFDGAYPDSYLGQAVERDGKLFLPLYHVDFTEGAAKPGTTFVVFDSEALSYELIEDERCDWGAPTLIGDTIIAAPTSALGASSFLLGSKGFKAPCLLRISKGASTFDGNWSKPFSDWTGERIAAELIPISEHRAYTRVFDGELGPKEPAFYWDFAYADAWRWGVVDPTSNSPVEILKDEPPAYGRVDQSVVDGETWTFEYKDANGRSQLAALREAGIVRGASFNGFIDGVVPIEAAR